MNSSSRNIHIKRTKLSERGNNDANIYKPNIRAHKISWMDLSVCWRVYVNFVQVRARTD